MNKTTKYKILETARELFRTKGYNQTSMREIINKSEVPTGTLYTYFENKEDILETIRLAEMKDVRSKVISVAQSYNEPLLIIALDIEFVLYFVQAYEIYAETIIISNKSTKVNKELIAHSTDLDKICFKDYTLEFTDEDFYNRSILIKGMLSSIIENYLEGYDSNLESKKDLFIHTIYKLFNVPDDKIKEITTLACEAKEALHYDLLSMLS